MVMHHKLKGRLLMELKQSTLPYGFPIKDLMFDVDSFEERATGSNNKKRGGSSKNSITHIKKTCRRVRHYTEDLTFIKET